ncbi:hypothetical protein [Actinomadura chibensis]|uniref:Tyrosine-type recombinase/integrase n=1 Tax=Actinomadura chibensis TaxID=392828 RepID=A0A5D0NX32_9ACTN|nr:hypothetical protein [Actinomadura chibensis]TYB48669.1 hypothetical protein FXF69_05690 [Actinomadura chibensis]
MYYAALRPEEAVDLRRDHLVSLPDDGSDEMRLTHSEPRSGSRWTDSGKPRDRQPLKHRAPGETRPVPIHPELVTLLRHHIKEFNTPPGGRPRRSRRCRTTSGTPPCRRTSGRSGTGSGAEWAGHSVAVLLRVHAKCVAGQEEDAMRRISEATRRKAS